MRLNAIIFVGLACGVAACSAGGSQAKPPTISAEVVESTVGEEPSQTTGVIAEEDAAGTTISVDPDEQLAADAAHQSFQTFDRCLSDTQVSDDRSEVDVAEAFCGPEDFAATDSGESLEALGRRFGQYEEDGIRSAADPLPSEHTLFWARKSTVDDGVVGVLECQRNYYVTLDKEGAVLDDSSQTALTLLRVVRGDDGNWRVDSSVGIELFQAEAEGGDSCSTFDGTEVDDDVFDNVIG